MKPVAQTLSPSIFGLCSIATFLSVLVYTLSSANRTELYFNKTSYFIVLTLLICWILQVSSHLRQSRFSLKPFFNTHWVGILAAFLVSVSIFISSNPGIRTLSDETNIMATSRSLTFHKTPENITQSHYYYFNLHPIQAEIPSRPLLFNVCVSIINTITGYRYQNALLLNFIMVFSSLLGLFIISRVWLGTKSSIAAILLLASQPVFSIFGTSTGFDLFSSFFVYASLSSLFIYLKDKTEIAFATLWLTLLMLAHTRYESFIFFFLVLGALILLNEIRREDWKFNFNTIVFTPIFLLPIIWQASLTYGSMKIDGYPGAPLFSPTYFVENVKGLSQNILNLDLSLPFSALVFILAIISIPVIAFGLLRKSIVIQHLSTKHFFVISAMALGIHSVIFLSKLEGSFNHPATARYAITFYALCVFLVLILRARLPRLISDRNFLIFAFVNFLIYHPIAIEGRFINSLTLIRDSQHIQSFIESQEKKNLLIITGRPGQVVAMDHGAIDFEYANRMKERILEDLDRHLYEEIYVIQTVEYSTGEPTIDHKLDPEFELQPIRSIQSDGDNYLRFSKVIHKPLSISK